MAKRNFLEFVFEKDSRYDFPDIQVNWTDYTEN